MHSDQRHTGWHNLGTNKITNQKNQPISSIYGRRVVREYIKSGIDKQAIKKLHLQKNLPDDLLALIQKTFTNIEVQLYSLKQMQDLFSGNHQGILVEFHKESYPGFSKKNWKEFLINTKGPHLCLDRISDVQNLGNIVRSAEALGASSIICCGSGISINETVHRISSGASFHIPIFFVPNLQQLINHGKQNNYWICASGSAKDLEKNENKNQPLSLNHFEKNKLPNKEECILLIGNEAEGLKKSAILNSDFLLSISLLGNTGSLNASVATAILLDRIIS